MFFISNLYLIIPRFDKKYPPLEKVLLPFSRWIYFFIIFVFIKVIALRYIFRERFMGQQRTFLYHLLVTSLGAPFERLPKKITSRFLVTCWIVLFFILRTSYCSFLYFFIRSDMRIVQPITIQSVLDNYKIFSTDVMFNLLYAQPNIQSKLIHEYDSKMAIFEQAFDSGYENGKTAFLMNIEMYGWMRKNEWVRNRLYLVPQRVMGQHYAIYMKKNSPLKPVFYNKFLRFVSFGLMSKWRKQYMDVNNINEFSSGVKLEIMNYEDVSGVFVIWACLLALSCVVFILEFASVKFNIRIRIKCCY